MATELNLLHQQVHKSRTNVLKYLKSAGFDTSPFENIDFATTKQMCSSKHANIMNLTLQKLGHGASSEATNDSITDPNARAFVHYYVQFQAPTKSSVFKAMTLHDIVNLYKIEHDMQPNDSIVLIIVNEVNDTMQKLLEQIWEKEGAYVNILSLSQLQFCVQEHSLVPKHEALAAEDKAKVFDQYYIKNDHELPQISRFDAQAKAICLRPGQLCKITRPSKTCITETYYRLCV